jgi:tetratricopeptide (TPR) repeat protein
MTKRSQQEPSRARWSVLALAFLGTCATPREAGWERAPAVHAQAADGAETLFRKAEEFWASRDEETSLRQALALYEECVDRDAADYRALVRLSRGSFFLAHAFTPDENERVRLWNEGAAWAERALATDPDFRAAVVDQARPVEEALELVPVERVDAVYWMVVSLGRWVGRQDLPTRFRYLGRIKALARRVEELDPGFHHGAAYRFWGAFYAEAPSAAGGSLAKSRAAFDQALEVSPDFFETRVLMAEVYAVRVADRELFTTLLQAVLAGDPTGPAGVEPEQRIEQRRARELLDRGDELFP